MDEVVAQLVSLRSRVMASELSEGTAASVGRVVLDSLSCALGASQQELPRRVMGLPLGTSVGPCTIVASGDRVAAEEATFVNSVLVRYLDYNDTYASLGGLGHPSDYISSVLAVAEEIDAPGDTVVRGIVGVYEAFCRMTDALPLGFGNLDHVVYGAIASAFGAGLLWGLSDEALAQAISLAVVSNVALLATRFGELSDWKGCAAANAARNGVFAARLGRQGVTGPEAPFVGRGGLCSLLGQEVDTAALEDEALVAVQQTHLKLWPCGVLAQSAIEAARDVQRRVNCDDVQSICVRTFAQAVKMMASDNEKWSPTTPHTADHSLPYVVACALAEGGVGVDSFGPVYLSDGRIRRLMKVLHVEEDPKLTLAWPGTMGAEVEVKLNSGDQVVARVDKFRGFAGEHLAPRDQEFKVRSLAEGVIGADRVSSFVDTCYRLEGLGAGPLLARCIRAEGTL